MESIKLTLPHEWVGRIMQIMSKQPYDQVADIIDGMKAQITMQLTEQRGARVGTAQSGSGATPGNPPDTPSTVQ